MTHAVCMLPYTPITLIHASVSVIVALVWAVLVVGLSPGRVAKGVRGGMGEIMAPWKSVGGC